MILIADVAPFFRYAVAPTNGHNAGVPFYTLKGALTFFEETKRVLPWSGCLLLKRSLGGLEVIDEYKPTGKATI